jgi:cyanophycinase
MTRLLCFLLWGVLSTALADTAPETTVGPAKGTLVIVGGGGRSEVVLKQFVELAGGSSAPIVIIPTAEESEPTDLDHCSGVRGLRNAGATQLAFIHTRDKATADSEAFAAPLTHAKAVWFSGGRHWRLTDAYLNTRTQRELLNLLDRGGVIGGSSAGATIQGSFMVRGDPSGNTIMVSPTHTVGLGFLKGSAIDQHVITRHRENDMIPVIRDRPELLGIGLDEDTAIVVQGDQCEVIGRSKALFYNAKTWPPKDGHWWTELSAGQRFDLKARSPIKP